MIEPTDYELSMRAGARGVPALVATRFCKGGGSVPQRDLYQETAGELQAKSDLAPLVFNSEARFDPLYASLNNQVANTALFGDAGGTVTLPTPGYGKASSTYQAAADKFNQSIINGDRKGGRYADRLGLGISGVGGGGMRGGNLLRIAKPVPPGLAPTTTINRPATPGLLDIASRAGTAQRTADINDWKNLSPAALAAIKASNPQLSKLIDSMVARSQYELGLGSNMDPAALRQAQQSVRARQAGMLGGTGSAGDLNEAMGISQFGQTLRQQRLANATSTAGLSSGYYTPQINDLMNRNYNPMGAVGMGYGAGGGTGRFATQVNANDLFSSNQNAAATQAAARANGQAAMTSSGISAGAGIASAALLAAFL